VLTGPTAVGKTELALRWAERQGAEIISCDSLLFYRGMDIGTAKPTAEEQARVRHHLVDVCEVRERMDVTRYVEAVRLALADLEARGRRVLVTGGSGFYLRAFFAPVADDVVVDPGLRTELEARLERDGLESLVRELKERDGEGALTIDLQNPRRVLRALERVRSSGRGLKVLAEEFARRAPPFGGWSVRLVRLERPPEALAQRVAERVRAMLAAGLEEEVRTLVARGLRENPSAARAIGYREVLDVMDGRIPRSGLEAAIVANTRALVKKQRTWFRTQLPAHRCLEAASAQVETLFDGPDPVSSRD
jgi:tRNA dimethylallyltransferase